MIAASLGALGALTVARPAGAHTDPTPTTETRPLRNTEFVRVGPAGTFVVGASLSPFRFVGTNAYFMLDAATFDCVNNRTCSTPHPHTDGMMCLAQGRRPEDVTARACPDGAGGEAGLEFTVLRMWGFKDAGGDGSLSGPRLQQCVSETVSEASCTVANGRVVQNDGTGGRPDYFQALDYVLHQADHAGVRVIVTLVNNWHHYGGTDQYLKWCDPVARAKVSFYTKEACKALYKSYVSAVLNRINKYDGRAYRDNPTILAWELANEPRCAGCPLSAVTDWIREMAAFIKAAGARQMVATGEEGHDCTKVAPGVLSAPGYTDTGNIKLHPWMYDGSQGVCYTANTDLDDIDFASFHLWPGHWKIDQTSSLLWIEDHVRIAKTAAADGARRRGGGRPVKPVVLGEFGSDRRTQRAGLFNAWLDRLESTPSAGGPLRGDGGLVWQIVCDYPGASCRNYAGRLEVLYPPAGDVSRVLKCHALIANEDPATEPPCP